jgi:hypothetical protein
MHEHKTMLYPRAAHFASRRENSWNSKLRCKFREMGFVHQKQL